jgi:large repetitive protein
MIHSRTATVRAAAALTGVALLVPVNAAYADNLVADGDVATTAADNALNFGNVCTNTTVTKNVALNITRNGQGQNDSNVFKNGSTVTLGGNRLSFPSGNTITLPTNWQTLTNNNTSGTVTAQASFTAGAAASGSSTFSLTVTASGTNVNNASIARTATLNASVNVVNCAPTPAPDTTAPTLTLPTAPVLAEATGPTGAAVAYTVSASDTNPTSPAVACTTGEAPGTPVVSGTTFRIGITTVSCSTKDAANNSASGSFTVVVRDTTDPVLTDVPSPEPVEATSAAGAAVSFTKPNATDAVGAGPVSCATGAGPVTSGATFPLGTTAVTCSAKDAANNEGTASFNVVVRDTTGPVIGNITDADLVGEATSAAGAQVNYTPPTATDAVTGAADVTCTPPSGSVFALGESTITCTATDGTNQTSKPFTMVVRDTQAPVIIVPDDMTPEATGPTGATVTYAPTANDAVDGPRPVSCNPESGTEFAVDAATPVTCSVSDTRGHAASKSFNVTVKDRTAPELSGLVDKAGVEAASANGAPVQFSVSAADLVDGQVTVACTTGAAPGTPVVSGATFPLGTTTVTCAAKDAHNNSTSGQFTVNVVDTTAPALSTVSNQTGIEATSAAGAVISYTKPTATDAVGAGPVTCTPASGATFRLGTTTVNCSAQDAAGNEGTTSFTVQVLDTTAPALTVPASQEIPATSPDGAVATFAGTATDTVDGSVPVKCQSATGLTSNSTFPIGTTTVKCTTSDTAGNVAEGSFSINVQRTFSGFFQPVDTGRTVNLVKAGSTLPLKFEVFAGRTELSAVDIFKPLSVKQVACGTNVVLDDIEQIVTGGTSLRYDTTAGQYIWNWKTPTGAGSCYQVAVGTNDGAELIAQFKLR